MKIIGCDFHPSYQQIKSDDRFYGNYARMQFMATHPPAAKAHAHTSKVAAEQESLPVPLQFDFCGSGSIVNVKATYN
jgi:hypothetical protein